MKQLIYCLILGLVLSSCAAHKMANKSHRSGDGSSFEQAIFITEKTETTGVAAEYDWLKKHYPGYSVVQQSLLQHDGSPYDLLEIKTKEGVTKKIYFDISNFFGKM